LTPGDKAKAVEVFLLVRTLCRNHASGAQARTPEDSAFTVGNRVILVAIARGYRLRAERERPRACTDPDMPYRSDVGPPSAVIGLNTPHAAADVVWRGWRVGGARRRSSNV
jgi:hypothetical protein